MELDEEARYTTDEESVMSEHDAINAVHTISTQSFEEELSSKEDLDEWLNAEMEKHMSKQEEKNEEDALIAIIKSIREECRVFYDDGSGKDYGMWPTCDPDSSFYYGYNEIFRKSEHGMLRQWVTLGFCSIAGGLDHANPVIRLPLEHGINRVLGFDDYSNPSVGTNLVIASIT
nr:hypothetical protein [Tanacetum cinerariifolium]